MEESKFYIHDLLGLKKLNEEKKVHFVTLKGSRVSTDWEGFEKTVVPFSVY